MAGTQYVMMLDDNGIRWVTINELLPLTNKGDMLVMSDNGLAGVAAGSNDTLLTADSTQSTGVAWNAIKLPTSAPLTPAAGATYFDTTADAFYVYNGSAWVQVPLVAPQ